MNAGVSRAASHRVLAGTLSELVPNAVLTVDLAADADGKPRQAIVLRDESGTPRAYRNLCQHLPVPLASGPRRFLMAGHLECKTHGARYRLADGLCVFGPCIGASLLPMAIELDAERIFVLDPSVDAAP